jgi:hypothetical protein
MQESLPYMGLQPPRGRHLRGLCWTSFSFDVAPATPTTLATRRTTTRPHPARCGRPSILAATLRTMNDTEDSYRADRLVDFVHDNQRRTRNRPSPE